MSQVTEEQAIATLLEAAERRGAKAATNMIVDRITAFALKQTDLVRAEAIRDLMLHLANRERP